MHTEFQSFIEKYQGNSEVFLASDSKNQIWLRATEVCKQLEFSDAHRTVKTYLKEHQYQELRLGMGRPALYISESGFYKLILKSKSVIAENFIDWLTEEVLPKLRSQGIYASQINGESLAEYEARTAALIDHNNRLIEENKLLASGEGQLAAIRYFCSTALVYSKWDYLKSDTYIKFVQKDFWKRLPPQFANVPCPNGEMIIKLVDRVLKETGLDVNDRPFISNKNGFGDVENATLSFIHNYDDCLSGIKHIGEEDTRFRYRPMPMKIKATRK